MPPLHRHQLVRLTVEGWQRVRAESWDDVARPCLEHWAARRLPLVVTRQAAEPADPLALGLAAPLRWQRRRIALRVERRHIAWCDEFPRIEALTPSLPQRRRDAWQRLSRALSSLGATTRVYGSHGWQLLSALPCVHPDSDIDLWTGVADAAQADAVAAALEGLDAPHLPRLDGELLFPDGRAFAWREWRAWRAGRCRAILSKTLHGASLVWSNTAGAMPSC